LGDLVGHLSSSHPDISRKRIRKLITTHNTLFCIENDGVLLYDLDHTFVREYLKLASNVEAIVPTAEAFSMSEPVEVEKSNNTIVVHGIVGAFYDSCRNGEESVVFQFDDYVAFRLRGVAKGNYVNGQTLKAVLHFR
jgi:hypothetical protein